MRNALTSGPVQMARAGTVVAWTPAPPRFPAAVTEPMLVPHPDPAVETTALTVVLSVPAVVAPAGTARRP